MPCRTETWDEEIRNRERKSARNRVPNQVYPWLMQKIGRPPMHRNGSGYGFNGDTAAELCHQCLLLGDDKIVGFLTENPKDSNARILLGWWESHKIEDGGLDLARHEASVLESVKWELRTPQTHGALDSLLAAHPEMKEKVLEVAKETHEDFIENGTGTGYDRSQRMCLRQFLFKHYADRVTDDGMVLVFH